MLLELEYYTSCIDPQRWKEKSHNGCRYQHQLHLQKMAETVRFHSAWLNKTWRGDAAGNSMIRRTQSEFCSAAPPPHSHKQRLSAMRWQLHHLPPRAAIQAPIGWVGGTPSVQPLHVSQFCPWRDLIRRLIRPQPVIGILITTLSKWANLLFHTTKCNLLALTAGLSFYTFSQNLPI